MVVQIGKADLLSARFQELGFWGVCDLVVQKFLSTWRRGEIWDISKFFGRSTETVRLDGCRFSIAETTVPRNIIDLLLSNRYEQPEREALNTYLDPKLPLIELGACVGVLSCISNRRLQHPENHVALEANPALIPLLEENRLRNDGKFKTIHGAVAYGLEKVIFNVNNENVLASSLQGKGERTVIAPAVKLARLIEDAGFENCTLLCDIEGAEIDMVKNELGVISRHVSVLIMETHERLVGTEATSLMIRHLETGGFDIAHQSGDVIVLINQSKHARPAQND